MEYKAVYKCRLCGEVYTGLTTAEELAEAHMVEINARLYGTVPFTVRKTDTHRCGGDHTGSLGLADFLGWSTADEPMAHYKSQAGKKALAKIVEEGMKNQTARRRRGISEGCV